MSSAETFLNLYRELEEALEEKYNKSASAALQEFTKSLEGGRFREELTVCREIRNVLTHHATIGTSPVLEPADELMEVLFTVVNELRSPEKALNSATLAENVLMATPQKKVLELMRLMEQKGYSHVPVWYYGEMIGVFSRSTLFSYLIDHPEMKLDEDSRVEMFKQYIPLNRHNERFLFADENMTVWEAREAFQNAVRQKRLAAIFITDTGKTKGRLLGMLTPWDVLGSHEVFLTEELH